MVAYSLLVASSYIIAANSEVEKSLKGIKKRWDLKSREIPAS